MTEFRLLLWNVAWGRTARARQAVRRACSLELDVICLTETTDALLDDRDNVLRSDGNHGYHHSGDRQKVALWSRFGWDGIDRVGHPDLPPGRFLSGVSNGVRFVGVCIPWWGAHVASGENNRKPWEDHRRYLEGLKTALGRYLKDGLPVCLLGDFNQTVPPKPRHAKAHAWLKTALGGRLKVSTAGLSGLDGSPLIDHIALTSDLVFKMDSIVDRFDSSGKVISDHYGLSATVRSA